MEENNQNTNGISKTLLAFNAFFVLGIIFMVFLITSTQETKREKQVASVSKALESTAFENILLQAKSAYVYDVAQDKVLYKKNETVQLPLASITKLMTALTATELVPADTEIKIKKEFLVDEGDTGLLDGESWKISDLLDFSLLVSSNDGARSVASVVGAMDLKTDDFSLGRTNFIAKMNQTAQRLGLTETYFVNESGLDAGSVSGGYGSAMDVAKLLEYIIKNHSIIVEATKYKSINVQSKSKTHIAKNTNTETTEIPGLLASKTGYTELAGGNLVVAFDASIGRPIIVVVLGSTEEGRFEDVSTLVNASLKYVSE
jgi:D-alanyl-D-alanine carboxypeptidase